MLVGRHVGGVQTKSVPLLMGERNRLREDGDMRMWRRSERRKGFDAYGPGAPRAVA